MLSKFLNRKKTRSTSIEQNSANHLAGHIDHIDNGTVFGWAANTQINNPINIAIYCGESLAGTGTADLIREDLRAAKIHDGRHGFKIKLNYDNLVAGEKLYLKDLETDSIIPANTFQLSSSRESLRAEIQRVESGKLWFTVSSDHPIGNRTLYFNNGDQCIEKTEINTDQEAYQDFIWLPANCQDGKPKLISIGVTGYHGIIGSGTVETRVIGTPWEYLNSDRSSADILALSSASKYRYQSIEKQLESISLRQLEQDAKNVFTAHKIVVESNENRSSFPKLILPKYQNPDVTIIIPAYNKFSLTYRCIASIILSYNKASYEVIVADDNSSDFTSQAECIIENIKISRNTENLGFLLNCNKATDYATGKYIIFLNNDTEVTSYWIDNLVTPHETELNVGLTGSKLLNEDGSIQEAGGIVWNNGNPWNCGRDSNNLQPEWNYKRDVDYVSGASMCISRSTWQKVGRFSEELAPCYYEDTDLAFKVRSIGKRVTYAPNSIVIHAEGKSHGTDINKGMKRYQVVNERTFRKKWFKEYMSNGDESLENLSVQKDRNVTHRVLVIDYASPQPNKDAGSYAAVQEIKLIIKLGYKVTFVPENLAHFGKYTSELQNIGVEVLYAPFYCSMQEVLDRRLDEMNAVYITRYSVAEKYIDFIKTKGKPVIFNNADLHFLREMRTALVKESNEKLQTSLATREAELTVCRKADVILSYNPTEHAVITSHILESKKIFLTPWVLTKKEEGPNFESRDGISFLGGFNHTPNIEAVEYLAKEIMPKLASKRPDIILYVYGSNMPSEMESLNSDSIKMIGFAENLANVFHNHRAFVAPLQSGAGIKGKVLDSISYGTPTILSPIAAEGTGLTHGISCLISDNADEWVDNIIQLYDNNKLWDRLSENQSLLLSNRYSEDNGIKAFASIFEFIGLLSDV